MNKNCTPMENVDQIRCKMYFKNNANCSQNERKWWSKNNAKRSPKRMKTVLQYKM